MTQPDPTETFRQEARDLLETLEQALLDLGRDPGDQDLVDGAFRALHTIKGSGAMFGFEEVSEFVHDFETAFDQVRKGKASIGAALIDVALAAKDHVATLIAEPGQHARQGEPILARLRAAVAGGEPARQTHAPASRWSVRFRLPADALSFGTNPVLLLGELRDLGPCAVSVDLDRVPSLAAINPEVCYVGWDVALETERGRDAIEDVFIFLKDAMELVIEPAQPDAVSQAPEPKPAAERVSDRRAEDKGNSSLRVSAERLDELLDRVGELVIAQSRLSQIASASSDPTLKSVAEEIERLSGGLRDTTMGIRMVPIGTLFGRFRRLVHDLSGELGKQITFATTGEETELDKTVVERLADPLVHIIRNAVDHGLETADRRIRGGKPAGGTVRLSAVHSGAEVAITICDDGAGIDAARVREKAEELGLLPPDSRHSDHELHQLIFHPGFSTAQEITALSGRGVGMDVVKRTMDELRGTIDVQSAPGQGTSVTLRLPLTLAIIDGMLVRVGKARYTIPLSSVEECVELPPAAEKNGGGRNFLSIRGSLVPFLRLRELFATTAPGELHQKVVIVSTGDQRVGLVVDQILGNNQTVVKSLSRLHAAVDTFSGATILGDGTVALILDVNHLVGFGQDLESRLGSAPREKVA